MKVYTPKSIAKIIKDLKFEDRGKRRNNTHEA